MAVSSETRRCPHCDEPLLPFELAEHEGWSDLVQFACFNDECSYYKDGWAWMWNNYAVRASYRYRLDPASGMEVPIPVISPIALRDRIVPNAAKP